MASAFATHPRVGTRTLLAIGTHRVPAMPLHVEWHECAHPVPDSRSVAAGERALAVARAVGANEVLVLLLSGGASALMASPIDGLSLTAKQDVIQQMLLGGADIHALNTVRKHLSRIKGGRLAAACSGRTLTLAISDVVGDDLAVIGSGPGVPDPTTWRDVSDLIARYLRPGDDVQRLLDDGVAGRIADTPKPEDPAMDRAHALVIASRRDAIAAAGAHAEALGYHVVVLTDDITGRRASRHCGGSTTRCA
jgi:hydroxypyruvate reductase